MTGSPGPAQPVPRQPVPGPHNQDGGGTALPCLLDLDGVQFTASGRAAILLGLEALALPAGARVLVPSYHCPTMVSPALALGLQVGFYPITAEGRPDLAWLDAHLPADARVICVAHLFGLPLDLSDVQAWCRRRGLLLLEDCAHAMFGPVGRQGDIAIASLPKFFPALDGGLLRVREGASAALEPLGALRELRAWLDSLEISARHARLGRWRWWAGPLLALKQALRGGPAAASPAPAPAARPQFDANGAYARIDVAACHRAASATSRRAASAASRGRIVARRREHYAAYAQAFAGRAGLKPLMPVLPDDAAPYVFPLWLDEPEAAYEAARTQGLPVSRWDWLWPGVPDLPGDQGKRWSVHVLQLHCHQDLSAEQRERIIATLLSTAPSPAS